MNTGHDEKSTPLEPSGARTCIGQIGELVEFREGLPVSG